MKKNKPVEVEIKEDVITKDGEKYACHELVIGKRIIGTVTEVESNKFEVKSDETLVGFVKSMDLGYEEVLRNWNLHN